MVELNNEEMLNISGGGLGSYGLAALIAGLVVFVIGFFDGITNPKKYNN